jgi:hypothetical protein
MALPAPVELPLILQRQMLHSVLRIQVPFLRRLFLGSPSVFVSPTKMRLVSRSKWLISL